VFSGKVADAYGVECVSRVGREMRGTDPSVAAERVERASWRQVSSEWVGGRTPSTQEEAWAGAAVSVVKWKSCVGRRRWPGGKGRQEAGDERGEVGEGEGGRGGNVLVPKEVVSSSNISRSYPLARSPGANLLCNERGHSRSRPGGCVTPSAQRSATTLPNKHEIKGPCSPLDIILYDI